MRFIFQILILLFILSSEVSLYAEESLHAAILLSRNLSPYEEAGRGIQESLQKQYPRLAIETVALDGDIEKGRKVTRTYAHYEKAVIFSVGTEAARSALVSGSKLPVIISMMYDPLAENVVPREVLAHTYGVPLKISWITQFHTLKKLVPQWKKYAVIYLSSSGAGLKVEMEPAAEAEGLKVLFFPLASLSELLNAAQTASNRSDALLMVLDRTLYNAVTLKELFLLAARRKYPMVTFSPNHVKSGALLSISTPFYQNGVAAARLGSSLLEGKVPLEHFVETPELWIAWNKKTAKSLGVKLSFQSQDLVTEFVE